MSTIDASTTGPVSPDDELDDWDDAPITPRARTPWLTKLLVVAAAAALAFVGGVYAHKQWGTSTASTGASSAGALARLFGGTGGLGGGAGAAGTGRPNAGGAGSGVSGQVSYIKGSTLYIADLTGSTIKVSIKRARITKTSTISAKAIHPGDTVVVQGATGKNGTVAATGVTVGGGIAAILGTG